VKTVKIATPVPVIAYQVQGRMAAAETMFASPMLAKIVCPVRKIVQESRRENRKTASAAATEMVSTRWVVTIRAATAEGIPATPTNLRPSAAATAYAKGPRTPAIAQSIVERRL
jgi:hypothetical protein